MNRRDFIARAGAMLAMTSAVAVACIPRPDPGDGISLINISHPWSKFADLTEPSIESLLNQLWDSELMRSNPSGFSILVARRYPVATYATED